MKKGALLVATALAVLVAGALVVAFTSGKTNIRQSTTTISSQIAPQQADGTDNSDAGDESGDDRSDNRGDDQSGDSGSDERGDRQDGD
jgi:hypothetical protein